MILGIELGSTRIKAVLIDEKATVLASGSYEWENQLKDGIWTYSLEDVEKGVKASYAALNEEYKQKNGGYIQKLNGIGVSAMMHGYLAFDKDDNLLTPFRTWRNTITGQAAEELTQALGFNIPQRWSVAHHYQAVLKGEEHVKTVRFLTTLAGYVHWKLTGKKVLGVGDASGMFPIDGVSYDKERLAIYNQLLKSHGVETAMESLLPSVLVAGEDAGYLTEAGAKYLDEKGVLEAGVRCCPPGRRCWHGHGSNQRSKRKNG